MDFYAGMPARLDSIRIAFGEYLDQRGYLEEAAALYMTGKAFEKSQDVYLKAMNVQMTLALIAKRQLSDEETKKVRSDLIENLINTGRFEDAGDLLAEATGGVESASTAFDCFVKAHAFQKAIKFGLMSGQADLIDTAMKPALLIALDLKSNQIRQ